MKNKLKALLPLLFVIALLAVMSFAVNAEECEHTNIVYVEPTMGDCHLQGYKEHWYCSDCDGYWLDEDLTYQVSRHSVILFRPAGFEPDVQHIEAVEPTCVSEGNIEYWYCVDCDRYWTDEALTQLTNRKLVLIEPTGHNVVHVEEVEPGCHTPGHIEYWYCTICNEWGNTENLDRITGYEPWKPSLNLPVDHYEAKDPTCLEYGNVEYWYCENCDQYWTDEALTRLTNRLSVRIGTLEHTEVYVAHKEPTCTENGNIEYWYCSECGTKRSHYGGYLEVKYVIPALGHDYVDGVCTVCGDIDGTTVTADGLNITVSGLSGVRDFLIAPGRHKEYFSIKMMYTARITSAKFEGMESYTYTNNKPGIYTVLVRYTDGREQTYHTVTLEAVMPEVSVNGVSVNISNLENIRTIRTAPGKWSTPGEVKRAPGACNIAARNIDTAVPYLLKYETAGTYTISFEYTTGLVAIKQIEIVPKTPTFEHVGHRITFGNLDDLYVIRYAPGEYSSSYDIKRAPGAKYIRPSAIDENGEIKLELPEGIYSFCVQYNDGSYNYYTIEARIPLLEWYGLTASADCWIEYLHRVYGNGKFAITFERDPANQLELPEMTASAKIEVKHYNSYQNKYSTLITVTSELNRTTNGKYILPRDVMETIGRRISVYDSDKVVFAEITFNSADRTETVMLEIDLKETKDYGELLGKYGLNHTASVWVDLMPGMGAPKSFAISFESIDGSEVPEMSINAIFSHNGMSLVRELRHDSSSNIYRASLGGGYFNYDYDELWFNDGDTVHVELTITINGESETIELDLVAGAVY